MKPALRLDFADFWSDFVKNDNFFYHLLARRYDVKLVPDPDFLIYSFFGKRHLSYSCHRIFYTGEPQRPDFSVCDFALSFDHLADNPAHFRLPLYALYASPPALIKPPGFDVDAVMKEKTRFCNLVASHGRGAAGKRVEFFHALSKYKRVDAGGRLLNNVGGPVPDKMAFIRNYKFTIAFENVSYPGYTSEKIVQSMAVNSLPIYWGNPLVHRDFNTRSFLNYDDYGSDEALIERIIEVDRNDDLYRQYLLEPWFNGNRANEFIDPERILDFFDAAFRTDRKPVAAKRGRSFRFGRVFSGLKAGGRRLALRAPERNPPEE
jgi:hypothetical protein